MTAPILHTHRPTRQRGSVVVTAAIAISLLVIALTGTELGYLFALKRNFQKTADLAALAGAQALRADDCAPARTAALANAAKNLPAGFTLTAADITCGRWDTASRPVAPHFGELTAGETYNAVRINMVRTPTLLLPGIPGNQPRTISVQAVAAQKQPRAVLNIRNSLATVDSTRSDLLNGIVGGLLGGSVKLAVVDWNGLVTTNINLLKYLDQLAIDLHVTAGSYDEVLQTEASVGSLLQAMITALQAGGGTAQLAITALTKLKAGVDIASATPLVKLGDLLGIQTGTPAAGMDLGLQVFQLVEGMVQLANKKNSLVADIPIAVNNLTGIPLVRARLKVTEPPQISAIGNPELARLDPTGPNGIRVRTAQIRALVSVDLPALNVVANLGNAVLQLLTPVTTLLNNVLTLKLLAVLEGLICFNCEGARIVLPSESLRLSIYLEAPSSEAMVTDVDCSVPSATSLDVNMRTSIAKLRIGRISPADETAAMTSGGLPPVTPIPLLDTETGLCNTLLLLTTCHSWTKYSRTGLMADSTVGLTTADKTYDNPPSLDLDPAYQSMSATNIVNSLSSTLTGLQLQTYKYENSKPNHFGDLIGGATQLVQNAVGAVANVVKLLLSPLLDPLVNALLKGLGVQLSPADVGARLSCIRGAELVY